MMSESKQIPFPGKIPEKLGELLQQAHLVSASQIEEALQEQSQEDGRKIGEILVSRGWLKQETADFFAEQWQTLINEQPGQPKQPLGYYLKAAALLDEAQIRAILAEQGQGRLWVRVGSLAVLKGWLSQSTVDFFLENLYPEYAQDSPFLKPKSSKSKGDSL